MIIITSILCLYGYYKCRRRQFRLSTERETFKFKYDINSYRWLGQQPSISSSSPYLIQSTSIWRGICLELNVTIIVKDFIPKYLVICMYVVFNQSNRTDAFIVHIYTFSIYICMLSQQRLHIHQFSFFFSSLYVAWT